MSGDFHYTGNELTLFAHALHWKKYWSRMIRPYVTGRVIEVGAGIGANIDSLWQSKISEWICLEPDADLAAHMEIRKKNMSLPENLSIIIGDLSTFLSSSNRGADTIFYLDVIEHIKDDHGEVARAVEALNPNGHLIILAPAHQQLFSAFDRHIGHYRRYNRNLLQRLVPPSTRVVMNRYLDSVGLLASSANRLFLRQSLPSLRQIYFWDRFLIPISRCLDPLTRYRLGKSCLLILKKQAED
jgi:hypothetical protein